ncbi:MAG: hypothetical protein JW984_12405 [Deltaproteobacteria bacterium]|uniref:Uncharacterized protein n=1 Tax=Candidatus Zymogenus saltonus TaxID=2844893 RepID=A0A9D8KGY8_9DELT|nr:hypothetical protein [Candidatus Zymogenus saltonus]
MTNNEREKCGLKDFFYHEYDVYMDLAKVSEENRDKYIRMYLITISALIGFACKIISDNYIYNDFFLILIVILVLIFSLSFIMARILCSGRIGNVKSKKRVNILRKYLAMMECKGIDVDGILLPTTSDDPKYWKTSSVTGTLLITVLTVMIICFIFILALSIYATISISNGYIVAIVLSSVVAPCLICKSINRICLLKDKDGYVKEKQEICLICEVLSDFCQIKEEDAEEEEKLKKAEDLICERLKNLNCINENIECNKKTNGE